MTQQQRDKALSRAWQQIRDGLGGPLGDHLDDARNWLGDRNFLYLANRFDAGPVIVACGIQIAADLLGGITPRQDSSDEDRELMDAVATAHAQHVGQNHD